MQALIACWQIDWETVDGGTGVLSTMMHGLLEAQKFLSGKSASTGGDSAGFLECTFNSQDDADLLMPYGRALFATLLFYALPLVSGVLLLIVWQSSWIHELGR